MSVIAERAVSAPFHRLPFTRACGGSPPRRWLRPHDRQARQHEQARQAAAGERARLLGDLHDGCGGQLVSALRLAQGACAPELIASALRDCLDDLRITLDGLDPECSELGPLLAGQRDRMESRLNDQGIALDWRLDLAVELLPATEGQGLHLLRILQEAVTNVLKHARAAAVRVEGGRVAGRPDCLLIRFRDDGVGLSGERRGRGLASMRRRAALMGGALTVVAPADGSGGTELELCVPLASVSA